MQQTTTNILSGKDIDYTRLTSNEIENYLQMSYICKWRPE